MADAETSSDETEGDSNDDTLPLHAVAQRSEGKGSGFSAGRGGRGGRQGRGRGPRVEPALVASTGLPSVHAGCAAFVQAVEAALVAMRREGAPSSAVLTEAQRSALEVVRAADLPARFLMTASLATSIELGAALDATAAAEWLEGLSAFAAARASKHKGASRSRRRS